MNERSINNVNLIGKCVSIPIFSYSIKGRDVYEFQIEIKRTSGYPDVIKCYTHSKLKFPLGEYVEVIGKLRSKNVDGKLENYVFATDVMIATYREVVNHCEVEGHIGTDVDYKTCFSGRTLSNFLFALNDYENCKSHYVSVLCWGLKAEWVKYMEKGTHLKLKGRIQSRDFTQKNGTERRVLELSVQNLEVIEDEC